jgi:hypothetical protein
LEYPPEEAPPKFPPPLLSQVSFVEPDHGEDSELAGLEYPPPVEGFAYPPDEDEGKVDFGAE